MFYIEIIKELKKKTDEIILFHSATGKDSIVLCDLLSKYFDHIQCVFMYYVKDLDYELRYLTWAKKRYDNIDFYQTPHFAIYSFIKNGYLGIKKNTSIENMTISKIDKLVKEKFNIEWSVYGFKKNDSLTRRIMLNGYQNGLYDNTKKAYPIMDMKNDDCLNYISDNNLIKPFNYSNKYQSSGCNLSDPLFLSYLRYKYPDDLRRIFNVFPFCEAILFKYDTYEKETKTE
jgi:3'-phosphoadenosine 5'-phosphosulfate sulfotransferase (PAPS reductase)/FAD synthetase